MQSLEDHRLSLNKIFQTIQAANQHLLNKNFNELDLTQKLIENQTDELEILWNSIRPSVISNKLDKEVSRWDQVKNMLDESQKGLNPKQKYEMKNILERWLLTLANDKREGEDAIFDKRKLNLQYSATSKMLSEMKDKHIFSPNPRFNSIIQYAMHYLSFTSYPRSNLPIIIDENTVQINNYVRKLPPGKLQILLGLNNSLEVLGTMIMRYACLLIGGQQWAVPLELYQFIVERYGVTIEGFASPINSQILYINTSLNYCSLFLDTDQPYGSLGDFFSVDFLGKSVYVNPPYVFDIMNRVSQKVIQICSNAGMSFVRFFITVPEWTDAQYYIELMSSSFLVFHHSFPKGRHYYVDTNHGFEKVPANFATHLFVLAVNIRDDYNEFISYTEQVFHT